MRRLWNLGAEFSMNRANAKMAPAPAIELARTSMICWTPLPKAISAMMLGSKT